MPRKTTRRNALPVPEFPKPGLFPEGIDRPGLPPEAQEKILLDFLKDQGITSLDDLMRQCVSSPVFGDLVAGKDDGVIAHCIGHLIFQLLPPKDEIIRPEELEERSGSVRE